MVKRERALRDFLFQACAILSLDDLHSIGTAFSYGGIDNLYAWYRDELFRQHKNKDDDHVYDCDEFLNFVSSELKRLGYYIHEEPYGDKLVKIQEEDY